MAAVSNSRASNGTTARSLIPMPALRSIGRLPPINENPHFLRQETRDDGKQYRIYKSLESFSIVVPVEDVRKIIRVDKDGASFLENAKTKENDPHVRANTFRKWTNDHVPSHLALSCNQPFSYKKTEKQGGRARKHSPLFIGMSGKCSAQGCPTTFVTGFTEDEIDKLCSDDCPEQICLLLKVNGGCIHMEGERYGQLRGPMRNAVIDKYMQSKMTPAEFAKHEHEEATTAAKDSKNRGALPSKAMSQEILREAKEKTRIASGLSKCALANIKRADIITTKQDLECRKKINDTSTDLSLW